MHSVSEKGLTPSHIKEGETAMGSPSALKQCTASTENPNCLMHLLPMLLCMLFNPQSNQPFSLYNTYSNKMS